ncbi:hypothetical protein BO86DRAFT_385584 [Aspergillus japonicus CBS 114.51]|uniref:Uncharacterized protein n=1 Tax=Aspergillus japonicus CBS 114.51 TaxID=1448312 RepID=A0A8T8XDD4_ASPJA|nr:hypothetical protein BO86DRAFT_385584 [Aspergillus japonicus CBS 114.51]RAH85978.1 hypothetical protein BO86DRAFT_385584 [Aspergillus japonicus CBS 114.51]
MVGISRYGIVRAIPPKAYGLYKQDQLRIFGGAWRCLEVLGGAWRCLGVLGRA